MNTKRLGNCDVKLFSEQLTSINRQKMDQRQADLFASKYNFLITHLGRLIIFTICFTCLACGSAPKLSKPVDKDSSNPQSETQAHTPNSNPVDVKNSLHSSQSNPEFEESLFPQLNKSCVPAQTRLYKQAIQSTQEYTQVFMQEMDKLKLHFQGFQLSMRRSQMMIFFGNGLIKRLSMVETIADCLPLYKQYQKDREVIFKKIEASNQSKSL